MPLIVRKYVEFADEIDIEVSAEDITIALCGETDKPFAVSMGMNNLACFMRAIPDSIIAEMKEPHRKTIREFLLNQAERF